MTPRHLMSLKTLSLVMISLTLFSALANASNDAEVFRKGNLQSPEMERTMPADATRLASLQHPELNRTMPVDATRLSNHQSFEMRRLMPVDTTRLANFHRGWGLGFVSTRRYCFWGNECDLLWRSLQLYH